MEAETLTAEGCMLHDFFGAAKSSSTYCPSNASLRAAVCLFYNQVAYQHHQQGFLLVAGQQRQAQPVASAAAWPDVHGEGPLPPLCTPDSVMLITRVEGGVRQWASSGESGGDEAI